MSANPWDADPIADAAPWEADAVVNAATAEPPTKKSFLDSVLQTANDARLNIGAATNEAMRSLTDTAGADNSWSQQLRWNAQGFKDQLSQVAQNTATADAADMAATEGFGSKFALGAKQALASPVQSAAKGFGYMLPSIATGAVGKVAQLGRVGMTVLNGGMGAAMGAGAVKGGIYDTVMNTSDADLMQDPLYRAMRLGISEAQARSMGVYANLPEGSWAVQGAKPPTMPSDRAMLQPGVTYQTPRGAKGYTAADIETIQQARDAIGRGAPRDKVQARLREAGIDPWGL